MPLYDFKNTHSGDEWEQFMSYADMKEFTANGDVKIMYNSMAIVGGHGDRVKPDNGMKELLSRVAEASPHSPLANHYGHKDSKSVKVRDTVQKHNKT